MQRFIGFWGLRGQALAVICGCLLLALAGFVGCGPDPEVVAQQEREAAWQTVELAKAELDAKRQELAEAREAAAAEMEEEAEDAADAAEDAADTAAASVEQLESEVEAAAQEFSTQLVEFINANAPEQGAEPPPQIAQAIRMKSNEDILVAQEFISAGGDYRRAIEIYDMALAADPDYERLHEVKADAESMRYMTEERFAQVENGMNREEVRSTLGPVNLRNIRDYEENDSVAWFYPKDDQGSAAAVWFRKKGDGYEVYQSDYNFKDAGSDDG